MLQAIRFLLSGVCHQLPAHSYWAEGHPLPLCARCSGTFLGVWAGLFTLWLMGRHRRTGLPGGPASWVLGALAALWALDGLNSMADMVLGHAIYLPTNLLRLASGAGLGVALSALVGPIRALSFAPQTEPSRVVAGSEDALKLLVPAGVVIAFVHLGGWLPYAAWVALLGAATVAVVVVLNSMLVRLVISRWPEPVAWAIGTLLALAELSGIALLRAALAI